MARTRSLQRYQARRDDLLDAAWELLLDRGYERTTLNGLVSHAGTSKGALYHYFASREELIDAAIDRAMREGIEEVEHGLAERGLSALEKLDRFLGVSARRPAATEALRRLLLRVDASGDAPLVERLRRRMNALCIAPLERILEQGIAEGVFDTPYPGETAELILAGSERVVLEAVRLLQSDLEAERVARQLLRRVEALVHNTERLLGLEPATLERLGPRDARALVDLARKEILP